MSKTITFRADAETGRILKELAQRTNGSKSAVIREALRVHWKSVCDQKTRSAWEVYSKLRIPPAEGPRHDRARHVSKLMREILLAKRRNRTL